MKFKVRDLGGVVPLIITDSGFILGLLLPPGGNVTNDVVLRPDGTMVTLPSGLDRALDINDAGLVLCRNKDFGPNIWLFDAVTQATQTFSLTGFRYVWPERLNINGEVVGSVAKLPDKQDRRGFIWHRKDSSTTWVSPTITGPPGAVSFLYLNSINDLGHAVGSQGWVGSTRGEVPIYYDGMVHQIGNPSQIAEGNLIKRNDRMRVEYSMQGSSTTRAIYDRATNTLTPFLYGFIYDFTASGMILSQENGDYFLRYGGKSYALQPSLVGWSNIYAKSINSDGQIAGYGERSGKRRGFILEQVPSRSVFNPRLAAKILWGVINGAGGVQLVGGVLRRIPPHAPLKAILKALPRDLSAELAVIVDKEGKKPIDVHAFSDRVSSTVAAYQRNQLHQSVAEPENGSVRGADRKSKDR